MCLAGKYPIFVSIFYSVEILPFGILHFRDYATYSLSVLGLDYIGHRQHSYANTGPSASTRQNSVWSGRNVEQEEGKIKIIILVHLFFFKWYSTEH